ncbi:MAG TPA: hypothetical protein PLL30_15165 [Candidatus Krumholzibacteria bacterium]|nr:hypothetical protein [Candidatus Krumholzibacteria bacterium]HPD73110.1 hypothetical protein [Candidatus Krumholzibacteria bacterium]HRY41910.1 hypothetical protein [Candidatus Krumholzibacteria bacterium]
MTSPLSKLIVIALLSGALGMVGACGGDDADDAGDGNGNQLTLLEPVLVDEIGSVAVNMAFPNGPPGCLAVVPNPWTDTDADEIPDTADFEFDAVGCAFDWGDASGTVFGVATITDLGTDLGYTNSLTAMTHVFTESDPVVTVTRVLDGTRVVSGTRQVLGMVEDLSTAITATSGGAAAMISELSVTFTADAGGEIHFGVGVPLPPGQYEFGGTLTWTEDGETTVFAVTTETPVVYDADCPSPYPVQGVVWLEVTDGPEPGRLVVGWNGCESLMTMDWEPAP